MARLRNKPKPKPRGNGPRTMPMPAWAPQTESDIPEPDAAPQQTFTNRKESALSEISQSITQLIETHTENYKETIGKCFELQQTHQAAFLLAQQQQHEQQASESNQLENSDPQSGQFNFENVLWKLVRFHLDSLETFRQHFIGHQESVIENLVGN